MAYEFTLLTHFIFHSYPGFILPFTFYFSFPIRWLLSERVLFVCFHFCHLSFPAFLVLLLNEIIRDYRRSDIKDDSHVSGLGSWVGSGTIH